MSKVYNEDEPYFRGLALLPLKAGKSPVFIVNARGPIIDGPCELEVRKTEMPHIDKLPENERYKIGVAMRCIASSLDHRNVSIDEAMTVYGLLGDAIGDWMDHHHLDVSSFGADTLVTLYLNRHSHYYAKSGVLAFRDFVRSYVDQCAPPADSLVTKVHVAPRAFDIEAEFAASLAIGRTLHVAASVYEQCEQIDLANFSFSANAYPCDMFRVQIDESSWLQNLIKPRTRLNAKWLCIDARESVWKLCEQVRERRIGSAKIANVTQAATYDCNSYTCSPMPSQMYVPVDGESHSFTCEPEEAWRIFRTAAALTLLMTHPKTGIRIMRGHRRASLNLPKGISVESLIFDLRNVASQDCRNTNDKL